jgi:O-Antigen ligase
MVRQAPQIADPAAPSRNRPVRRSLYAARTVRSGAGIRIAGMSGATLIALFVAAILTPAEPMVAGIRLTAYTVFLLLFGVPLVLRYLQDESNRLVLADVFAVLYVLWLGLAIGAHHGPSRIVFVVNQTVLLLGGYLVGRVLVRTPTDYQQMFRWVLYGLIFLFPFALIEFVTQRQILNDLLGLAIPVHPPAGDHSRLGFYRVQGVFENPILFGLFCSIAVANFYYVFSGGRLRHWSSVGLAGVMTFFSLSSAATISMGLQLALIAWDRISRALRVRHHWIVLGVVGALAVAVLQLATQGGVIGFVIENFAYDEDTGWGRTEILRYGSAEVLRHPVFGIGFDDWTRPWWKGPSVDNFWLLTAMRYGLPALVLVWVAVAVHILAIVRQQGLSETAAHLRSGYVVAWAGLFFMLGTVHAWGAISVFVMTYLGAGVWFYAGGSAEGDEPPHRRPSDAPRRQRPVRSRPHTRVTAAQA